MRTGEAPPRFPHTGISIWSVGHCCLRLLAAAARGASPAVWPRAPGARLRIAERNTIELKVFEIELTWRNLPGG